MESAAATRARFELTRKFRRLTLPSVGNKGKNIVLAVVSLLAILVIGIFFALWNPTPPPAVPMPSPNGYTAFTQAGALVQRQTWDFDKMNAVALRSLVDANSNALQTARSGFTEKSRVPIQFSPAFASAHIQDLMQIKTLAYAFIAEGRLAEMEQRTNDAARSYLDVMRLAINSRRGGPFIDTLVGIAEEAVGTARLEKLTPSLDAKTSAEFARQLETLASEDESWEQVAQNEKYFIRGMYPDLQHRIAELFTYPQLKASKAKTKQKYEAQQNQTRRLMLDLAAHAYQ